MSAFVCIQHSLRQHICVSNTYGCVYCFGFEERCSVGIHLVHYQVSLSLYTKSMSLKYEPASEPLHITPRTGLDTQGVLSVAPNTPATPSTPARLKLVLLVIYDSG